MSKFILQKTKFAKLGLGLSLVLSQSAMATKQTEAPTLAPHYEEFLGRSSYIPVVTQKLANPKIIYADLAPDKISTADRQYLLNKWGWAVRTVNEPTSAYLSQTRIHSASFYGGNGMNGNIGDGRTSIDGDENFKGIGPTGMVNPHTEEGHNSGTLKIDHAILETVWSKLLDLELPFGANRVRGILGTGTVEDRDGHPGLRVVIVRDDFLRPAHFITNETSIKVGRSTTDRERVTQAVLKLPEALPQPHSTSSLNRMSRLSSGLNEFIDRLANQTAYSWTHSMYHGAMSPSNVTLSGAAADFGTFQALGGYPSIQLLSDCAPNGDFSEEIQVLKEFHSSVIDHAPSSWKSAIGSFSQWTQRFQESYHRQIRREMLSLSGAFPEFLPALEQTLEAKKLGDVLLRIAKAGNEEVIQTWLKPLSFETGTYQLPRILQKLAHAPLTESSLQLAVKTEVADLPLRAELTEAYLRFYQQMNLAAETVGISSVAAQKYRIEAAQIRNQKMTELFRTPQLQLQLNSLVENYTKTGNESAVRTFIEQKINASRRNFKDAAAFTVVRKQTLNEKNGRILRQIYDAKSDRYLELEQSEKTPLELNLKRNAHPQALSCAKLHY